MRRKSCDRPRSAEAEASALKVKAGLSPLERAQIDKETAIGVAEKLAQVQFPEMLVIGGSGEGKGPMNPFDEEGLESFIKISRELSKEKADVSDHRWCSVSADVKQPQKRRF